MAYHNPWIPQASLERLSEERGTILDVGGGAAPYYRACHIVDILSFDAARMHANAWGRGGRPQTADCGMQARTTERVGWSEKQYTQWDVCDGKPWPFADNAFDLGLSSHCLEDLRDPLPAVRELSRVCRRVLIITPSRLLEQVKGINLVHEIGFRHHHWMVYRQDEKLVFQAKTGRLYQPGCYLVCPAGRTLPVEAGSSAFFAGNFVPYRKQFADEDEEIADLRDFVARYQQPRRLFVRDPRARSWRYWVYRWKQMLKR